MTFRGLSISIMLGFIVGCSPTTSSLEDGFLGGAVSPPTSVSNASIVSSTTVAPLVSWTASTSSTSVGFGGYEISLGSAPGKSDILAWTDIGNVLSYTPSSGFTLSDDSTYFASVRAYSSSGGRSSVATGGGFLVNALSPTFSCDFTTGALTDCYASPYLTTTRPLLRFYRSGGANTSPGTYFTSAGTMSTAGTNLHRYSQDFTTVWVTARATITGAAGLAPDGTSTANVINEDGSPGSHYMTQFVTKAGSALPYTCSAYAKAINRTQVSLYMAGASNSNYARAIYDLNTGAIVVSANTGGVSPFTSATALTPIDIGNGWYRVAITATSNTDTTVQCLIMPAAANNYFFTGASQQSIYVWGAQLEEGSSPTSYIYTAATSNYGPRIDHDPSSCSGTCTRRGLLIEQASTNHLLQSGALQTGWALSGMNAFGSGSVANAAAAPDGTTTAALLTEGTNTGAHSIAQSVAGASAAQTWTYSIFAKAATRSSIVLAIFHSATGNQNYGNCILSGSGSTSGATNSGNATGATLRVQALPNGWYRCSITGQPDTSGTGVTAVAYLASAPGNTGYTGDGTSGLYLWGAQLESGSVLTSYIPTTTSALTRNGDYARAQSVTGWLNSAKGTLIASGGVYPSAEVGGFPALASLTDGTGTNDVSLYFREVNSSKACRIMRSGVPEFTANSPSYSYGNTATLGIAYQANDAVCSFDGTTIGTSTSNGVPTVSGLDIGAIPGAITGHVKTVKYYDERLSNTKMNLLTSQ